MAPVFISEVAVAPHVKIVNSEHDHYPDWLLELQRESSNGEKISCCDVHLICNEGYIPVHRPILLGLGQKGGGGSTFLMDLMGTSSGSGPCFQNGIVGISLADVRMVHLKAVVSLIYRGEALIPEEDKEEVDKVIQMLQLNLKLMEGRRVDDDEQGRGKGGKSVRCFLNYYDDETVPDPDPQKEKKEEEEPPSYTRPLPESTTSNSAGAAVALSSAGERDSNGGASSKQGDDHRVESPSESLGRGNDDNAGSDVETLGGAPAAAVDQIELPPAGIKKKKPFGEKKRGKDKQGERDVGGGAINPVATANNVVVPGTTTSASEAERGTGPPQNNNGGGDQSQVDGGVDGCNEEKKEEKEPSYTPPLPESTTSSSAGTMVASSPVERDSNGGAASSKQGEDHRVESPSESLGRGDDDNAAPDVETLGGAPTVVVDHIELPPGIVNIRIGTGGGGGEKRFGKKKRGEAKNGERDVGGAINPVPIANYVLSGTNTRASEAERGACPPQNNNNGGGDQSQVDGEANGCNEASPDENRIIPMPDTSVSASQTTKRIIASAVPPPPPPVDHELPVERNNDENDVEYLGQPAKYELRSKKPYIEELPSRRHRPRPVPVPIKKEPESDPLSDSECGHLFDEIAPVSKKRKSEQGIKSNICANSNYDGSHRPMELAVVTDQLEEKDQSTRIILKLHRQGGLNLKRPQLEGGQRWRVSSATSQDTLAPPPPQERHMESKSWRNGNDDDVGGGTTVADDDEKAGEGGGRRREQRLQEVEEPHQTAGTGDSVEPHEPETASHIISTSGERDLVVDVEGGRRGSRPSKKTNQQSERRQLHFESESGRHLGFGPPPNITLCPSDLASGEKNATVTAFVDDYISLFCSKRRDREDQLAQTSSTSAIRALVGRDTGSCGVSSSSAPPPVASTTTESPPLGRMVGMEEVITPPASEGNTRMEQVGGTEEPRNEASIPKTPSRKPPAGESDLSCMFCSEVFPTDFEHQFHLHCVCDHRRHHH